MLEPQGEKIELEPVDTQTLGLKLVRRTIGLVPQDLVIFSGTVRSNMDPFDEYEGYEVWRALTAVQLSSHVSNFDKGLLEEIQQDEDNLSFGQRQLISIARVVLRQPSVLLIDEATSAIDPRTQELVVANLLPRPFRLATHNMKMKTRKVAAYASKNMIAAVEYYKKDQRLRHHQAAHGEDGSA